MRWTTGLRIAAASLVCAACDLGTASEPEPWRGFPTSPVFATTPAAVRDRAALGALAPVPETVVYTGEFRKDRLAPRMIGVPCENPTFHLAPFEAQVFPWTHGDARRCVADGVCPTGIVSERPARPDLDGDDAVLFVDPDTATRLCHLHGGEVLTAAQHTALVQGGERRVAWEAFEVDVLTRCSGPIPHYRCEPYLTPRDVGHFHRASEPEAARGPYGHLGLMGHNDLVRVFASSRAPCAEGVAAMEEHGEEMGRTNSPLTQLFFLERPETRLSVSASPLRSSSEDSRKGRVRCAFLPR